jgi:hypothetical protein
MRPVIDHSVLFCAVLRLPEGNLDATVTASISGGYRAATRLDPAEYPEVDLLSVVVDEEGHFLQGADVVGRLPSNERQRLEDLAAEVASEDAEGRRADALEREADFRSDR